MNICRIPVEREKEGGAEGERVSVRVIYAPNIVLTSCSGGMEMKCLRLREEEGIWRIHRQEGIFAAELWRSKTPLKNFTKISYTKI